MPDYKTVLTYLIGGVIYLLLMYTVYALPAYFRGEVDWWQQFTWGEAAVYFVGGMAIHYVSERSRTYIERKNERWRKRRSDKG